MVQIKEQIWFCETALSKGSTGIQRHATMSIHEEIQIDFHEAKV